MNDDGYVDILWPSLVGLGIATIAALAFLAGAGATNEQKRSVSEVQDASE